MPGHRPNPSPDNEGQIRLLVEQFLRDNGWKIRKKPSEQNVRPDLIAERRGERLLFEIKRASEGRRDRVIPLLSQAALEAAHYSRNLAGHPIPVAIVGSNYIPDSVADEAKQFVRERAPDVAVGLVDLEGLRSFAGYGLESVNSERRKDSGIRQRYIVAEIACARSPAFFRLESMDAQGSASTENFGRVSLRAAWPVPGSLAAGRCCERFGDECISLRRPVI